MWLQSKMGSGLGAGAAVHTADIGSAVRLIAAGATAHAAAAGFGAHATVVAGTVVRAVVTNSAPIA